MSADLIGVHPKMPANDYHAIDMVSASRLKQFVRKTPAHYAASKDEPLEQTEAMLFGTLAHAWALDQNELKQFAALPDDFDGRTKEGKALKASWDQRGITSVKNQLWNSAKDAALKAIQDHPHAFDQADREISLFTLETGTNTLCKARIDLVPKGTAIWDLKFTEDASQQGFERNAYALGYHIQAAFYLDVWNSLCGDTAPKTEFKFLVVERTKPYANRVFKCADSFIERGRADYQAALVKLVECQKTDVWPGYDKDEAMLFLPAWVK